MFFRIYKEIIAAKRVESSNVISVIPRLNWNTALNPTFDMYKPDYSAAPSTGGTAKQTTNNNTAKTHVLPVPLFACTTKSLPDLPNGMARNCTGEGL